MDNFILTILTNVLLLLGITSIFSIILKKISNFTVLEYISSGLFVGGISIAVMSNSFIINNEIFIDARTLAIATSGLFLGVIPTIIGGLIAIAFRIIEGGEFVLGGSLWIFFSGLIALLYKKFYIERKKILNQSWYELFVFSTLLQLIMLIILYIFVPQSKLEGYQANLFFSLLVLFPLAHTILLLFMQFNINRVKEYSKMLSYEKQYRSLFEQGKIIHFLIEPTTGRIVDVNNSAMKKYGYTYEEFTSLNVSDITVLSNEEITFELNRASKSEKNYFEFKHITKAGIYIDVEVYSGLVKIEDKDYLYSTVIDVTEKEFERKMYLDRNEQLKTTIKLIDEAIFVTDEYHNIVITNDKAKQFLTTNASSQNEKVYEALTLLCEDENKGFKNLMTEITKSKEAFTSKEKWELKTEYKSIKISFSISPIIQKNLFNGTVLMIRDVSKELSHKEEIEYVSYHDYLTGLYNRHFFEAELKRLDTKRQLPLTLFIADVNDLKLINDAFGHLEGDELIKEISIILKKSVRTEDIVARWGGDEFAILLPQTNEAEAGIVYQRIQKLLKRTTYDKFTPSISIGYATKNSQTTDMNTLLKIAEERMYEQKMKTGKSVKKEIIEQIMDTLIKDNVEPQEHINQLKETLKIYADHLNLDEEKKHKLQLLAKYHDIGKIGSFKDTLLKSSPLTNSELEQIKTHPILGSKLINVVDDYKSITKEISMSHEHYNGNGYPYGLQGNDIPEIVRIFAIVEAYLIMLSGSNYKGKLSKESALKELEQEAGNQFDPEFVAKFIEIFK